MELPVITPETERYLNYVFEIRDGNGVISNLHHSMTNVATYIKHIPETEDIHKIFKAVSTNSCVNDKDTGDDILYKGVCHGADMIDLHKGRKGTYYTKTPTVAASYAVMRGGDILAYKWKSPPKLLVLNKETLEQISKLVVDDPILERLLFYFKLKFDMLGDTKERDRLFAKFANFKSFSFTISDYLPESSNILCGEQCQDTNLVGTFLLDDLVYSFLTLLCIKYGYDGTRLDCTKTKFIFAGVLHNEYYIINQDKLIRDKTNKYDVNNWMHHLWGEGKLLKYNPNLVINCAFSNEDFCHDMFYNSFYETSDVYDIATLNVHHFESINMNDTEDECMDGLIQFAKTNVKFFVCVQEIKQEQIPQLIEKIEKANLYHTFDNFEGKDNLEHLANVVISHKPINILEKKFLKSQKFREKYRYYILFQVDGINQKFACTHLEIISSVKKIRNPQTYNATIRVYQIHQLIKLSPDFIIGDLNINIANRAEMVYISNYYSMNVANHTEYTTPYNNRVDYICSKYPNIYDTFIVPYKYSDHRAVCMNFK